LDLARIALARSSREATSSKLGTALRKKPGAVALVLGAVGDVNDRQVGGRLRSVARARSIAACSVVGEK